MGCIDGREVAVAEASWLVSLAGAVISAGAAVTTVVLTRRAAVRDRREAAAGLALRYREPLVHAAFNLQTRLNNIVSPTHRFLQLFLTDGTPAEAEYARLNTVYLLGQYLCWSEILRREGQFIDPVDQQRDREVMEAMEGARETLSDSIELTDPTLRAFRGEQRAIGEVLLTRTDNPSERVGPRWDCLGYAAFVTALEDKDTARWFTTLLEDVDRLAEQLDEHRAWLVALQHALLKLINLLDPNGDRVSAELRQPLEDG
jgi:hypothetical protein